MPGFSAITPPSSRNRFPALPSPASGLFGLHPLVSRGALPAVGPSRRRVYYAPGELLARRPGID